MFGLYTNDKINVMIFRNISAPVQQYSGHDDHYVSFLELRHRLLLDFATAVKHPSLIATQLQGLLVIIIQKAFYSCNLFLIILDVRQAENILQFIKYT